MIAIIAITIDNGEILRGENSVYYVDNSNSMDALTQDSSATVVIRKMIQIFWEVVHDIGIIHWFELVPSVVNIADLPTRNAPLHFNTKTTHTFGILGSSKLTIKQQTQDVDIRMEFPQEGRNRVRCPPSNRAVDFVCRHQFFYLRGLGKPPSGNAPSTKGGFAFSFPILQFLLIHKMKTFGYLESLTE